jgi:hypothetical protein
VLAQHQRHLQPYTVRNVKDILRQCDQHGIDHPTPVGATPLMLAARAGNLALVDALLERGADAQAQDEFGQTAWQQALSRAIDDSDFARQALAPLFDRLAPAVIDVQVQGRLVRIERQQAEYWLFTLMLAGVKTQWSRCPGALESHAKYGSGFFAEQLHRVLTALPVHLWKEQRRKRSYVSQVLARAEVQSLYRPTRQLWARTRNGHYLPNPALLLRQGEGWQPVYEALQLDWIERGCHSDELEERSPATVVDGLVERLAHAHRP